MPRDEGRVANAGPVERAPHLTAVELTKRFGDFVANDAISLDLLPGEVHVLLGENGAGKSTFMNMLYGHLEPDGGNVELDGVLREISSPAAALALGIGMVHQHFSLVQSYTVAENVVLGVEPGRLLHTPRKVNEQVADTVARLGWDLDVRARVSSLPVSVQQRVEILKLLHRGARILLLDEPTALLAPTEIESLLDMIEALRDGGAAIMLVTHKLKEVERVADRVTVLRHGRVTGSFARGELDAVMMARAMTGRDRIPTVVADDRPAGRAVLEVRGLTVMGRHSLRIVDNVDLTVRAGEIVGIAAVEGNGQHELVQALCGLIPAEGSVRLDKEDVSGANPRQMRTAGLGVIPADRRTEGVVGDMTLMENYALNDIAAGRGVGRRFVDWRSMRRAAIGAVKLFDIRPGRVGAPARSLSGGNMQKLVVAREFAARPKLLIAVSPTWGLDVGAVADIQQRLVDLRDSGCAVLLSSPDLDELMALSDRIVVVYRGAVVMESSRTGLRFDDLAQALLGVRPSATVA